MFYYICKKGKVENMSIFGIDFCSFGTRKLRFDSGKSNNVNFNGIADDKINSGSPVCVKYAIPSKEKQNPNEKPAEKNTDDAPTLKYGIPADYFKPYVNITPSSTNEEKPKKPEFGPHCMKYAVPGQF